MEEGRLGGFGLLAKSFLAPPGKEIGADLAEVCPWCILCHVSLRFVLYFRTGCL